MKETLSYDEIVQRGLAQREIVRSRALRKNAQPAQAQPDAPDGDVFLPGIGTANFGPANQRDQKVLNYLKSRPKPHLDDVHEWIAGLTQQVGVIDTNADAASYAAKSADSAPGRNAKAVRIAVDGMHDRDPLNQIAIQYARGLASEDASERQNVQNTLARLRTEAEGDKKAERKYRQLETLTGFFLAKLQDSQFPG